MEETFPLLFAAVIGFGHAFEADHILAVSTLVSKSKSNQQVLSNGFIWGLGHTSTIFIMGLLFLIFQVHVLKEYFDFLEIFVGIMLILLGVYRLWASYKREAKAVTHSHDREAYGIGLVHGLAGSGGLILLVMADLESKWEMIAYLSLFGIGSALGMAVAAILLRLPILKGSFFEQRKRIFVWIASILCVGYGVHILLRFI
ncbi:MAG: urease accessory protein [Bacteroidia bacterium]|nr:urease accessory protein [Bacteroidia bacterium]